MGNDTIMCQPQCENRPAAGMCIYLLWSIFPSHPHHHNKLLFKIIFRKQFTDRNQSWPAFAV